MSAPLRSRESAFSLVEVTMAFGIVAFAIVVLMGLLPAGLSASREGSAEEAATEILTAVAADIGNTDPGATQSALYGIPTNPSTEVLKYFSAPGARVRANASGADFRMSISGRASENPSLRILHVTVSWPPEATVPTGSVETLVMRAIPARL